VRRLLLAGVLVALAAGGSAHADGPPPALVGGDYYGESCTAPSNVLGDDADPTTERQQLFAMHASGLNSAAYVLGYTSDEAITNDGHGGAILIQPDGTLGQPFRDNLIRYLTDVRQAGFANVTIRFYPYGPNSPADYTTGQEVKDWDPLLYPDDWRLVQDVHDLVKRYGPAESHFDLMAEGPPSDYDRSQVGDEIDTFIERLYTDYVNAYGSADVFFSAVDKDPAGDDPRLAHLIEDLEATGKPLPQWWGLDIEYTGAVAARNLADADATLRAFGVGGSLSLDETAYESPDVAAAVQGYNAATTHPVVEVEEYPNLGTPQCIDPPFTGNAYMNVLGIPQPGPLLARVDAKGRPTLTTSDGIPVVALKAGSYAIMVTDASRKAGFKLAGSFVSRHTSAAFRGTVTWTVNLVDSGLDYRATGARGTRPTSFAVLG